MCQTTASSGAPGADESPAITAYQALHDIATSMGAAAAPSPGRCFYNKPNPGQLKTIFTEIAADLQRGTSALIDESVE